MAKKSQETEAAAKTTDALRQELVEHFRENREPLRKQWIEQMTAKGLLAGLTKEETETESATIYDTCVGCLETGKYDAARAYANMMAERGVLRGMTTEEILGGLLILRDIYGRSLFNRYQRDTEKLAEALDVYEPVANNILSIVALAFLEEREKVVRQQQQALLELSTPVLQVQDRMLILPIIGMIDTARARQLTEQLLRGIRDARAKVVVMDITGVPNVDSKVANHLIQTAEAARILGATVVITGVAPEIAQTVVSLGVDTNKLNTEGDLQAGIDVAYRLLGYKAVKAESTLE